MPSGVYQHKKGYHFSEEIKEKFRLAKLGKKLSPEHKRNISLANKGKKHSKEWKRRIKNTIKKQWEKGEIRNGFKHSEETRKKMRKSNTHYWKGKNRSEETKKKISLGRIGKYVGEKCPAWKGGLTPLNHRIRKNIEFRLWRESVFARDGWTCQKYGIRENLCVHHINNFADFPELRTSIENGITLSKKAHDKFHKKYGFRNNTKEQLEEFLCGK